jgi:hypothetical protein
MTRSPNQNDDQLGAALGESLRGRVDDVPTITPGFDGVERRARQITNRRRALAGTTIGVLVLFGGIGLASLGDDESADPTDLITDDNQSIDNSPEPTPPVDDSSDGYPLVVPTPDVADPPVVPAQPEAAAPPEELDELTGIAAPVHTFVDGVFVEISPTGNITDLLDDPTASRVVVVSDGSLVVERSDPALFAGSVVHLVDGTLDGATRVLAENGRLAGGADIDGRPVAFVLDRITIEDETTPLRMVDIETGTSTDWKQDAEGIEWTVGNVDVAADRVLVHTSSLSVSWTLHDLDGERRDDLASPGDGRYGPGWGDTTLSDVPNLPCCAVLSDDGATLYWLEHPQEGYQHDAAQPATLRSLDVTTGVEGEPVTVRLPGSEEPVTFSMDMAGNQILVSVNGIRSAAEDVNPYAGVLVDVADGSTKRIDLPGGPWTFAD